MRRAQNADTHAHKQHRLSQNISLSAPVLYWLSHLTCISSLKAKNERETFIFTQLKISRYNPHFFAIFRRIDLRPIYCSLTCAQRERDSYYGPVTGLTINPMQCARSLFCSGWVFDCFRVGAGDGLQENQLGNDLQVKTNNIRRTKNLKQSELIIELIIEQNVPLLT